MILFHHSCGRWTLLMLFLTSHQLRCSAHPHSLAPRIAIQASQHSTHRSVRGGQCTLRTPTTTRARAASAAGTRRDMFFLPPATRPCLCQSREQRWRHRARFSQGEHRLLLLGVAPDTLAAAAVERDQLPENNVTVVMRSTAFPHASSAAPKRTSSSP